MEKYGVEQRPAPEGEKQAAEGNKCGVCGESLVRAGSSLWCMNCGTAPLEGAHDDGSREEDRG